MKRKVLYSLICAILLFSAVSVAFASVQTVKESDSIVLDESDTQKSTEDLDTLKDKLSLIPGGALEATEEQIKKWENVEPEWSKSIEFDIDNGKIFPPVRAKWRNLTPFNYYSQETNYTCGPACVRMALKYLASSSNYSESEISDGCNTTPGVGTYLADMVEYINGEQNKTNYIPRYQKNISTMRIDISECIINSNASSIIGVIENSSNGWPYDSSIGHFVTVYGAYSDRSCFAICDPWAGFVGDSNNRWYPVSDQQLFDAYNSIDIGYMC